MLVRRFFGENLFDEFFDDFAFPRYEERRVPQNNQRPMPPAQPMRTDVQESDTGYKLDIELPGVRKENLSVALKDGYLTIHAETKSEDEQKDSNGNYIRRERFFGTCSRSFYVGEDVTEQDIKAQFQNGVLTLCIPKKEAKPQVETERFIPIEG